MPTAPKSSNIMPSNFRNPVRWEDLPDPEVLRVGNLYYMSASSFHFSPGAPILESCDLVNWKYIGHSVPELPPGPRFSLDGSRPVAYGKGVWASTLKYRESNGLFYFYTAIQGTDQTYIYTAEAPGSVWTAHPPIERFYYDLGLLIDDDDIMYIAYGTKTIEVAQLSADGMKEVTSKVVYTSEDYFEGARMYKINGTYYIWITKSSDNQSTLKSTVGPFGPYELRETIDNVRSPIEGAGPPHQGGLVDTPKGEWYFMSFIDAFPTGRVPVLAPVFFDDEGWPNVVVDSIKPRAQWRLEYPSIVPDSLVESPRPTIRKHEFRESRLDHCWQWNHNPDNSKWKVQDGQLVLQTGTVTESLHLATNTLTHRTTGPGSIATFCLETSEMREGDRAGLAMFRDESAYIGIHQNAAGAKLVYVDGSRVSPISIPVGWLNGRPAALDWKCVSNGTVRSEIPWVGIRVWLRIKADMRAAHAEGRDNDARLATFEYSQDGIKFTQLGPHHALTKSTQGYVGYRFGLFNFATVALGGAIRVNYCDIETWDPK